MNASPLAAALLAVTLAGCGQAPDQPASAQPVFGLPAPSEAASQPAAPVAALKGGEQVYQEVCAACHAAGVASAPKAGDTESWAKLIAEGQAVVTAHGWVGVRAMPAQGGRADLSLEEFARAVAWMARSAGADWQDPDAALLAKIREEETKRIEALKAKAAKG